MSAKIEHGNDLLVMEYGQADRRSKPRLYEPISVKIRGIDAGGEMFETETAVDNLSAGGLYVRLKRLIAPGAKLFFIIRLSSDSSGDSNTARIAVRGMVKRAEIQFDGSCGLAVVFTHHRFL